MTKQFGSYGASHPSLASWGYRLSLGPLRAYCKSKRIYDASGAYARERTASMQEKLRRGEPVYLVGLAPCQHNAGAALVEVSKARGVRLLHNNEEERFQGIKHYSKYPELSVELLKAQMRRHGIGPEDIHACLATCDYPVQFAFGIHGILEEFPRSLEVLRYGKQAAALPPEMNHMGAYKHLFTAPSRFNEQLGLKDALPLVGLRHHDNHAYFSYAVSPFAQSGEPVMVTVLDGLGDDGSISLYVARNNQVELVYNNQSGADSLGVFYGILSATQGGWHMLSSEGRYMGAAAWGNRDRLTNPYYRRLRQLLYFERNGQIFVNRKLANWHHAFIFNPYSPDLIDIIGPPIPVDKMWSPDVVLRVEDIKHAEVTQERVDKAAAVQLVFEDALFHIVDHFIRRTGSNKLVMTGGAALNCVANMHLLEHFDEAYFERYLGRKNTRLHLWVPPTPSDAGTAMGAAYHFALAGGGPLGEPLCHAFYCGDEPSGDEIREAVRADPEIAHRELGSVANRDSRERLADLLAFLVSHDAVIGLFQGAAETGPRALGHRSILANPNNPRTREILNELVKHREIIRPLAPMATYEAAKRCFDLSAGAADDLHNAYNYMVLTAPARPESHRVIPAVIHQDGTARVQIVREDVDPFTHAYLKAMGRRAGEEVSVNTSLNVGSPIVQSPVQALRALKRSKGMDGLFMIGSEGDCYMVWHTATQAPKDGGVRLQSWFAAWQDEQERSA